jgi:hypothetical protein
VPQIPGVSSDRAVQVFEKLGYRVIMSNGFIRLTIPRHKSINAYTMGAIAKAADLSPEEFKKLL